MNADAEFGAPRPGEPSAHAWQCGKCGKMTHDSYVPAVGFMTDTCAACRGYVTTTPEAAHAEIAAREAAWAAEVLAFRARGCW
jgi:hypothetical protein